MAPYKCFVCQVWINAENLTVHMNTSHKNLSAAQVNHRGGNIVWMDCNVVGCQKKFKGNLGLNIHRTKDHQGNMNMNLGVNFPAAAQAVGVQLPAQLHGEVVPDVQGEEADADAIVGVPGVAIPVQDGGDVPVGVELAVGEPVDMGLAVADLDLPVPGVIAAGVGAALENEIVPGYMLPAPFGLGLLNGPVLDESEYASLIAAFMEPLDRVHPTWIEPFRAVSTQMLQLTVHPDVHLATRAICALELLPGLTQYCNRRKRKGQTAIGLLRSLANSDDPVSDTIRVAEAWLPNKPPPRVFDDEAPNIERVRAFIEVKAGTGRLKSANHGLFQMQRLIDGFVPAPPLTEDQRVQIITSLHPPANELDVLEEWEVPQGEGYPVLSTTADAVRKTMYTLEIDKAPGTNGWTNSLLRILNEDKMSEAYLAGNMEPNIWHHAMAGLANAMAAGTIRGVGRDLLCQGKLSLIPKADGVSRRPIRAEGCYMRVLTATLSRVARTSVSPFLRPRQMGGGMRYGVDIHTAILETNYDADGATMSLDLKNAFGSARHNIILRGLKEMAPHLIPFFVWKYGTPSDIRDSKGRIVASTSTGVGQGDPWGSLFFEVAVNASLVRVHNKLVELETEYFEDPGNEKGLPGAVVAYEDDIAVCADLNVLCLLAPLIPGIFAEDGFEVNLQKSFIFGRNAGELGLEAPEGYQMREEGVTSLGIPVGNIAFRRATVEQKLEKMRPPIDALKMLNPRTALLLLVHCLNTQPGFLVRGTAGWEGIRHLVEAFDTATAQAAAAIFRFELDHKTEDRLFLVRKHGGLGLVRHSGMSTEKGRLTIDLSARAFLSLHLPDRLLAHSEHNFNASIRLGRHEGVEEFTGLSEDDYVILSPETVKGKLVAAKKKAEARLGELAARQLQNADSRQQQAAWILSACDTSTKYMSNRFGITPGPDRFFGPAEFILAGRALLGVGPSNEPDHTDKVCTCRKAYKAGAEPFHALSCAHNGNLRTERHTEILKALATLIRQRHPVASGAVVQVETEVGTRADGTVVIADIVLTVGAERWVIDIKVVDMGAQWYRRGGQATNPAWTRDAAAVQGERNKMLVYNAVVHPAPLPPAYTVPFVVEATGRFGPRALSFLRDLTGARTTLRSRFIGHVSRICALSSGRQLKATRDRFLLQPGNGEVGGF